MIKLGIIGMSPGNGHPYSWAAIFNGYDPDAMASCPFPAIPEYLSRREWPEDAIADATVSHVWTQDPAVSRHIARAACIGAVVKHPEDMLGEVDGILLARDDAENHYELARPFLSHGLPVCIDKPVATSVQMLDRILALERAKGQIFSCTAFRYADAFALSRDEQERIGDIRYVRALAMKTWSKYAVHVIEPVMQILGFPEEDYNAELVSDARTTSLLCRWPGGLRVDFTTVNLPGVPIRVELWGDDGGVTLAEPDPFQSFRAALEQFKQVVAGSSASIPHYQLRRVVETIERGMGSG